MGEELYSREFVEAKLPPSSKLVLDLFNGRWQVWVRLLGPPLGPWRSFSRSWGTRSARQCVKECLAYAWTFHIADTGNDCPIAGLFDPEPEAEAAAAGSAG